MIYINDIYHANPGIPVSNISLTNYSSLTTERIMLCLLSACLCVCELDSSKKFCTDFGEKSKSFKSIKC